jgi:hypothetical protein
MVIQARGAAPSPSAELRAVSDPVKEYWGFWIGRGATFPLQFSGRSAPFSWIDVRDGLRETPMVPGEILDIVLPFAVGKVGGFPNNPSAA